MLWLVFKITKITWIPSMHVESGYQRPYWKLVKLATGIPFNICQYGSENDKLLFHRWFLSRACKSLVTNCIRSRQ